MHEPKNQYFHVTLPPEIGNRLRQIAAERMLENPSQPVSVTTLCREILKRYLDAQQHEVQA